MYSQVLQLILNIFSNAIKFKKENEPMVIEIGIASNRGKDPCYYIKDNGIGIENTYLDKVFGLFERLDTEFFSLFDLKPSTNHYLKLGSSESLQPHFACGNQVVLSLV